MTGMKSTRQHKIIELIQNEQIDTQEELAQRLQQEGFSVTQATVSRDIRALKLTKITDRNGKAHYALLQDPVQPDQKKYNRVLEDSVLSVTTGQNLVVVRTGPGMAMGAAAALDGIGWKEILGCIAGDDTIMCACATCEDAQMICSRLREML